VSMVPSSPGSGPAACGPLRGRQFRELPGSPRSRARRRHEPGTTPGIAVDSAAAAPARRSSRAPARDARSGATPAPAPRSRRRTPRAVERPVRAIDVGAVVGRERRADLGIVVRDLVTEPVGVYDHRAVPLERPRHRALPAPGAPDQPEDEPPAFPRLPALNGHRTRW